MSLRGILFFALFISAKALAQSQDSVTLLSEVVIEQQRVEGLALGHYSIKVDSGTLVLATSATAADLMQKFGLGHVRSYGPGDLTTLSLRGTGAGHSSILWNGVPLQSPQNGQSDLSLIPTFFADDIHLQMGGSASINGNGAIGGTLHLNSKPRFNNGLNLGGFLTGASFTTGIGGLRASWSGKKFSTDSRLFYLDAVNDFPFTNTNVFPAKKERRANAAYRRFGIMHRDFWIPAPNWLLQLEGWLQDNHTQLPNSTSVSRDSQATQEDDFLRAMVGVQYTPGPLHLSFRSAIQRQRLDYRGGDAGIAAFSGFTSSINSIDATWFANSILELTTGLNTTYEASEADDYEVGTANRTRIAAFGAAKLNYNKFTGTLSAREELVDGDVMPFAPSFGIEYGMSQRIKITGNLSRSYRIPTMNDLYWSALGASGNPDLAAEESWSEEAAIHFQSKPGGNWSLTWTTTAFSSQVNNWILWRYKPFTWMPENIKKVWSRGSESKVTAQWKLFDIRTSVSGLYSFTKSTNSHEPQLGKQLVFTPVHEGSLTLKVDWNKWAFVFAGNVTGKQYTDDDNNESFAMDPYATLNSWISRDVGGGHSFRGKIIAEINNLLDASYESRPGYPMPGRNYRLSINFNFHKPLSK